MEIKVDVNEIEINSADEPGAIYIEVLNDGPYLVHGEPPVIQRFIETDDKGTSIAYRNGRSFEMKGAVALCRCGHSKNAPYCDGHHAMIDINLEESASFTPLLDNAELIVGPRLSLADNKDYCAFGRFCDAGKRVWNEVKESGEVAEEITEEIARNCPGGRLVVWSNDTKLPVDDILPPSIGLIEDPKEMCSGPLAVWGGIRVQSASGGSYEIRTRQALCRCGASSNKPFCDGTHARIDYKDGIAPE